MATELSKRGKANVSNIMPHIPRTMREAGWIPNENSIIDLSVAENWLIRDEILEIHKKVSGDYLNREHLGYPKGFWGDPELLRSLRTISTDGYDSFFRLRADVVPVMVPIPRLEEPASFLSELEATFQEATRPIKALMLSNPHNPLGRCYTRAQLEACLSFCQAKAIHLISDEVFGPLVFDSPGLPADEGFVSILSLDSHAPGYDPSRVHMIWSPSKVFALAGMRLGCTITQAHPPLRDGHALAAFHNVSILPTLLTTAILHSPTLSTLSSLNSQRHADSYALITSRFKEWHLPYLPCNASPFVMAKIAPRARSWEDEAAVVQALEDVGVRVSAGRSQHLPSYAMGWARITFAVEPG
ncbi:MAG: hypothetical protein Q9195_009582, partial [Heterodermia aff. obscurata]